MTGHELANRTEPGRTDTQRFPTPHRDTNPGRALQRAAGNQASARALSAPGPVRLVPEARSEVESAFGVDLRGVRIHGGEAAGRAASAERALAFARGEDVFVGPSAATPAVLAHELAHVVQQARGDRHAPGAASDLEAEAEQVQGGAPTADVSVGAAPHGSVQRFWPFEEEKEEPKRLPPDMEEKILRELRVDKTAWKRWIDQPQAAEFIRGHGMLQRSYQDDAEFQKWIKDPKYRPPGAPAAAPTVPEARERPVEPPKARPEPQTGAPGEVVSGEGYHYESGKPVQGPVVIQPSEVLGLPVKRSPQPAGAPAPARDWAKESAAMTPEQRAKAAYPERTTPRQRYEQSRRGAPSTFVGKYEKSLLEFEETLKMIPGVRAGVPLAQVYWGEDILGRPVSRWEALKAGVTTFGEDLTLILGPEDLMVGKGAQEGALITRELGENIAGRGIKVGGEAAPIESVLTRSGTETVTMTEEAAQNVAKRGIELPPAEAELPLQRTEPPTGIGAEAESRAEAFTQSGTVDPGRKPRGFETGRATPGRDVAPGGLEGMESHAHEPTRSPRSQGLTRAEQLEGLQAVKESHVARSEFGALQPDYAKRLNVRPGGQVHHAIELQVLDEFPGAFTKEELNAFENMRGIPPETDELRQLHNSKIRYEWDRHYAELKRVIAEDGLRPYTPEYNATVRRYLTDARDEVDYLVGQFFSEQRAAAFPKSVGLP